MEGWLGGSPLAVLAKLLFLSLVVGAIMAAFGLTPGRLLADLVEAVRHFVYLGIYAFHDFAAYIITGAVIVVPLWLVGRLLARR